MASAPRTRKTASPHTGRSVKASLLVDGETHARWCAAAALEGVTNNAFALDALKTALKGVIVVDRRKTGNPHSDKVSDVTDNQD